MRKVSGWHIRELQLVGFLMLGLSLIGTSCLKIDLRSNPTPPASARNQGQTRNGTLLTAVITIPDAIEACNPLPLDFTITNAGQSGIYLLKWYTPLEGVKGDIFQVTYQGKELDYLGPMVMRGDPLPESYLNLNPGESSSASVDLASAYPFHQEGEYQIKFRSPRISDTAVNQGDFPVSVEETGPVEIPSVPVKVRVLPAEDGVDCQLGGEPPEIPPESKPIITLSGVVQEASPIVRVVWLDKAVQGINSVVLMEESVLTDQHGEPLALNEVLPGLEIEAFGHPGEPGVLLAEEVVVHR